MESDEVGAFLWPVLIDPVVWPFMPQLIRVSHSEYGQLRCLAIMILLGSAQWACAGALVTAFFRWCHGSEDEPPFWW
jgi:hypothetical protein